MEGVLVLQDVVLECAGDLGELERPAHAVGKLSPGLGVGAAGGQGLVNVRVPTAHGWGVAHVNIVAALVDDNGVASSLSEGDERRRGESCAEHRDVGRCMDIQVDVSLLSVVI